MDLSFYEQHDPLLYIDINLRSVPLSAIYLSTYLHLLSMTHARMTDLAKLYVNNVFESFVNQRNVRSFFYIAPQENRKWVTTTVVDSFRQQPHSCMLCSRATAPCHVGTSRVALLPSVSQCAVKQCPES